MEHKKDKAWAVARAKEIDITLDATKDDQVMKTFEKIMKDNEEASSGDMARMSVALCVMLAGVNTIIPYFWNSFYVSKQVTC